MSDSAETQYEEARRCPRCNEPGKFVGQRDVRPRQGVTRGAKLHMFECPNDRCKKFGEIVRLVQVNPDGSIPPGDTSRRNHFPALRGSEADAKRVQEALAAQVKAETQPGGAEYYRR